MEQDILSHLNNQTAHITYIARHIPEIQYNLDTKSFEPRNVHITTKLLEQALDEYQFLNMFAEDPEKPEHESEEEIHTTRITTTALPSERSILLMRNALKSEARAQG